MRPYLSTTPDTTFCRSPWPPPDGMEMAGKRSPSRLRKRGTSWATNFDKFMSRSVRMISRSSSSSGLSRFVCPAVRSTDRMLRSPKS